MNLDNETNMRDEHGRIQSWYVGVDGEYEPRPMCLFMDLITMETKQRRGGNHIYTRLNGEVVDVSMWYAYKGIEYFSCISR